MEFSEFEFAKRLERGLAEYTKVAENGIWLCGEGFTLIFGILQLTIKTGAFFRLPQLT
jgi:hypothetical protein